MQSGGECGGVAWIYALLCRDIASGHAFASLLVVAWRCCLGRVCFQWIIPLAFARGHDFLGLWARPVEWVHIIYYIVYFTLYILYHRLRGLFGEVINVM